MSYYENVKENAEEYLKHVPGQGITHKYEYTNILIGTTIMQLLSVIADELHDMNERSGDKAEPVRHGHWIRHPWAEIIEEHLIDNYECSECHHWQVNDSNYCPNCGAKMDGVQE